MHQWIEPLGLASMLVVALMLALVVVRHHGRWEQARLAWAERRHPLDAPARTLIAFGVAFACVIAFARIGREVARGRTSAFDTRGELFVHRFDGHVLDHVMKGFTFVGSAFGVLPVVFFVLGWALRRREYRAATVLALVAIAVEALNVMLKDTFSRARPTLFEKIEMLHSYSFPSGHAMAAAAIYGTIGLVLTRLVPAHRRIITVAVPVLVLMIGLSRIYLGVHWPTDVIAGFCAGGFLLLAAAITLDGIPHAERAFRALPSSGT